MSQKGATRADSGSSQWGGTPMDHRENDGTEGSMLEFSGSLDVRRTAEVRAQVYALLDSGTGNVVVDISQVHSIDITTLKMLAVANRAP